VGGTFGCLPDDDLHLYKCKFRLLLVLFNPKIYIATQILRSGYQSELLIPSDRLVGYSNKMTDITFMNSFFKGTTEQASSA